MKEYIRKYDEAAKKHSNRQDLIMAEYLARLGPVQMNAGQYEEALQSLRAS